MHILLVVGDMHPNSGGPPQVVAGSAMALAARGHRVTIATLAGDGRTDAALCALWPNLVEHRVAIRTYRPDRIGLPGGSRAMARNIGAHLADYDAMHAHGVWETCSAQVARLFRHAGKPVVISSHGMLDRWSMAQSRIRKRAALALTATGRMLRHADAIVFGTSDERDEARHLGLAPGVVIPNGINIARADRAILPDATPLYDRFPAMARWSRTLLFFGRVHPKKGLDLLVDAMIAKAPRFPDTGLLVVGIPQDADYLAGIEARIAASPRPDLFAITTDLVGAQARMAFRPADLFVLPSHQEGFSMAIVEAMAFACPVLITDRCHLPEVAEHDAGRVVPDTVEGIATGLDALLPLDGTALGAMGARGRALVRERYDWDVIAGRLETAYARSAGAS